MQGKRIWSRSLLGMLLAFTVLLSSGGSLAGAQDVAPRLIPDRIISIPISDGVKLAAAVYLPPNAHGKYPVLLAASALNSVAPLARRGGSSHGWPRRCR